MTRYFRIGIGGEAGTGKTTLIKTIRKDARILILDIEGGLMSIDGFLEVNKQNIEVRKINNISDINILKKYTNENVKNFDYLVVDSLSFMYKIIARSYIKDTQKVVNANEIQHYGQMAIDMFDILNAFKKLDINIIYLMHTKNISDNFQQRFIQLDFVGNDGVKYILNDLDFMCYITQSPIEGSKDRVLITENLTLPPPDNRRLEFCKKRDEFNIIKPIEPANINNLLTNFITKRNEIIKQQRGV